MSLNKGYSYREILSRKAEGHTVLSYLVVFYKHSSEKVWLERLERAEIILDDSIASGVENLKAGQVLIWNRPPWQEEAVPLQFGIIYEDADLLVVNKPSGLPTVPAGGFLENTLLSLVRQTYQEASPLHRLGRGTSGLVLFTRSKGAASILSKAWQTDVEKVYRALASGLAEKKDYEITAPIGLIPHPKLGKMHAAKPNGKPATSYATILEHRQESTLFSVSLGSGRPHPIRIHMAFIGHPLVGDPLYTYGGVPFQENSALPGDIGYHLHAETLRFRQPVSGERLELKAPTPSLLQSSTY